MVKPVEQLTDAAEEVARTRELLDPIDVAGADEVGRLATSFNTMLAALGESREQQRRLVQDASHELRTPLTSLRTNIEVLQRGGELPADERERLLADVDLELRELSDLVGELVALATDASTDRPPPTRLELRALVDRVVERARRRTGHQIEVQGSGPALELQLDDLERAIGNLLDNAAKWSPQTEPIEVTVRSMTDSNVPRRPPFKLSLSSRFRRVAASISITAPSATRMGRARRGKRPCWVNST